ncbi:MAG: DUF805 domain-containing protein [Candidatus Thiodiazotropha sp.]
MTTQNTDPYTTPQSEVNDASADQYGETRVFSFSGRIGRLRYLAYSTGLILLWFIGGILAAVAIPALETGNNEVIGGIAALLLIVLYLFMLVASFALAVRRINDFDTSGWLSVLLILPLLNLILMLVLWFVPGTRGQNKYGLQPPPNTGGVVVLALIGPIILVAYIGVMASVAIPAYQQYVERAQQMQQGQ